MRFSRLVLLAATLVLRASPASAGLITFDDLRGGHQSGGELVTDQYASVGVTFVNSHPGGAHADNVLAPRPPGASSPNYLWVDQWSGGLQVGQYLQVDFAVPVSSASFTYLISLRGDMTIDVYDSDTLISTTTGTGTYIGADVVAGHFSAASGPISAIRMYSRDDRGLSVNFGIDDLAWTGGVTHQTPEPGGLALAAAGLFLLWARPARRGTREQSSQAMQALGVTTLVT